MQLLLMKGMSTGEICFSLHTLHLFLNASLFILFYKQYIYIYIKVSSEAPRREVGKSQKNPYLPIFKRVLLVKFFSQANLSGF